MTKRSKEKLTCPCCNATVSHSGLKMTLGREIWIWGMNRKLASADLRNGHYQWACDACLDSGRAIPANPLRQLYCDFDPCLAYFDILKTCENCAKDYTFFKEEQLVWYEKLRFWVQSKPKYCAECRKNKRQKKNLNTELTRILVNKENLRIEDMERLSVIYDRINRPDKSKYYLNLINKAKRKAAADAWQTDGTPEA